MSDKLGLTEAGRKLMAHLHVPRDAEDLTRAGLVPAVQATLRDHGLIEPQNDTQQPAAYQAVFGGWKSQRGMLIDHTRTLAFQRAIEAVVQPGDTVIDVGTGSGILAMMAARAGAAQSWGLELTEMAEWAERIARRNGLDAVRIVRGDAAGFVADAPAALVMGEFAGMYLIEEWRHYAAFVKVRNRNLRPGGTVLPRAARLYLSAVDSRKLYQDRGYGFWESPVYGFDFSDAYASDLAAPQRYIVSVDNREICGTRQIADFDFLTGTETDYCFTTEISFPYPAAGAFHGLIGHFDLDMGNGAVLSTSMAARETCWHQSYFPMPMFQVPAGGQVDLRVRSFLDPASEVMHLGITVLSALREPAAPERVFVVE